MLIGFDPASENGDYGCRIGYRIDENGIINIEDIKYFPKKEVKKVNKIPYFKLKVVKVKKVEKCKHLEVLFKNGIFKCTHCGHRLKIKRYDKNTRWGWTEFNQKQPKGNWVNGENLDKIKFPVPCSYKYFGKTRYAILSKGVTFDGPTKYHYSLINLHQDQHLSEDFVEYDLKEMIINHDINILKGKIIIFEEEN